MSIEWGEAAFRLDTPERPDDTVVFADAGGVVNISEPDPDLWEPLTSEAGSVLFRTPDNMPFFDTLPSRAFNRHDGRLAAGFLDGQVLMMQVGEIGFQYPVKDPRAKWDRY